MVSGSASCELWSSSASYYASTLRNRTTWPSILETHLSLHPMNIFITLRHSLPLVCCIIIQCFTDILQEGMNGSTTRTYLNHGTGKRLQKIFLKIKRSGQQIYFFNTDTHKIWHYGFSSGKAPETLVSYLAKQWNRPIYHYLLLQQSYLKN